MNPLIYPGLDFDLVVAKRIREIAYEYIRQEYPKRIGKAALKYSYTPGSRVEIGYANLLAAILCMRMTTFKLVRVARVLGTHHSTISKQLSRYYPPYAEPIFTDLSTITKIYETRYPFSLNNHRSFRVRTRRKSYDKPFYTRSKGPNRKKPK